jgi:hypothetical protein
LTTVWRHRQQPMSSTATRPRLPNRRDSSFKRRPASLQHGMATQPLSRSR